MRVLIGNITTGPSRNPNRLDASCGLTALAGAHPAEIGEKDYPPTLDEAAAASRCRCR